MFLKSLLLFLLFPFCISIDTIGLNQYVKDGDTLISTEKKFELGFFSPGNSSYRYVGIWYAQIPESPVVWVANRDNPINDSSGVLTINRYGDLVIHAHNREDLDMWSTKASVQSPSSTTSAQLLNTGNLVLFQGNNNEDVLWQSFDYPTDTMLPGMKLGLNRVIKLDSFLTSWKSQADPATGDFSYRLKYSSGSPQFFLYNGTISLWRGSPWPWVGTLLTPNYVDSIYTFVNNQDATYMIDSHNSTSGFSRFVLNYAGTLQALKWNDAGSQWEEIWGAPKYKCDRYGHCGPFSTCIPDNIQFECACLPGYQPRSLEQWNQENGSDGCLSNKQAELSRCMIGEAFIKVERVKLPDASISALFDTNLSEKDCKSTCQKNCSCIAYSSLYYDGGVGCLTWHGALMDILLQSYGGLDLYIRGNTLESGESRGFLRRRGMLAGLILAVVLSLLLIMLAYWWLFKKNTTKETAEPDELIEETKRHPELQFFDLNTLMTATDNFSRVNELGQGGFGSVYKGQLPNEQKVAVKRLSKTSGQGTEEFKNEVALIARLQHRNLVKLLGCCIKAEERMLVLEYMPNKSLDSFLFDRSRRSFLDWEMRFEIINGIARGVLYLHQDSRLRIIHRDLKTSNVLLDAEMNPKISDFGMARIFDGDQVQDKTNRVVGTYGYMSPEYALFGRFSIKSDVFSFGIILLEVLSGKRNNSFSQEDPSMNLIRHVWDLWREDRALEIVDSTLESYNSDEVMRCIQVALLCVQEESNDRPAMSAVVFMLSGETSPPSPNQPAYVFRRNSPTDADPLLSTGSDATNDLTITTIGAR